MAVFLFLPLEALLLGELLGGLDLVAPLIQKILSHLLLSLRHLVLELLIPLFIPLTTVGVIAQTGTGH